MLTTKQNTEQPGGVAGPVQRIVGNFVPPRDYPCLCCAHWDRGYKNAHCDACTDHDRWTPKRGCKSPNGAMLCGTCKHANKRITGNLLSG